ncbi:hypothetical protein DWZ56_00485 [Lachnotalea sp. AF33-28]|nr:hypothetical protein DWZ56_00485 [Lachnotalea sp. AF33-28]
MANCVRKYGAAAPADVSYHLPEQQLFYYIGCAQVLRTLLCNKKPSGQERTAAEWNDVAEATRRRRRIPRAGFFLVQ